MQQRVEVQRRSGGGGGGSGGEEGRVKSVRNRVEGEGARVDGGGWNDVDGVAGQEGGRVPGDDGVGQVG